MTQSVKYLLRVITVIAVILACAVNGAYAETTQKDQTHHSSHKSKHHSSKHKKQTTSKKSTKHKSKHGKSKSHSKKSKHYAPREAYVDPVPSEADASRAQEIVNSIVIPFMHRNHIPGLAVEIYDNGVPHSFYFGYANREQHYPVSGNTIFEIASITKIFTALLVALEVNAGKMNLNDSITKHMPSLNGTHNIALKNVTIKDLGTHTAIMPFNLPNRINNKFKLSDYLNHWRPFAPVGTRWRYSNVSIGLLGFALEAETHQNIDGLYQSRILKPLGMQPLGINVNDPFHHYYAQGYAGNGRPAPRRNGNIWLSPPTGEWMFPAAGAIKASSKDMALFLRAAIGLPGTPQVIMDAMRLTQTPYVASAMQQQGLGWVIHPNPKYSKAELLNPDTALVLGSVRVRQLDPEDQKFHGDALMEKTGATGGFRSYIAVIPDDKSGVVLLMNRYVSSRELKRAGRSILLSLEQQ